MYVREISEKRAEEVGIRDERIGRIIVLSGHKSRSPRKRAFYTVYTVLEDGLQHTATPSELRRPQRTATYVESERIEKSCTNDNRTLLH